jgi:hypothetical protein
MRIVTPVSKFAAELKPIVVRGQTWKPVFDRDYDGVEWHNGDRVIFATPDWDRKGKVTFLTEGGGTQHPVATFILPTQLNMGHRVGIYQRQAAKVLARV